MIFIDLSNEVQITGYITFIAGFILILLVLRILMQAIRKKNKQLYFLAITLLFVLSPWYPNFFGFVFWLLTRQLLTYEIYTILGTLFIPIAFFAWSYIYINLTHPKYLKKILIIDVLFSVFYEVFVLYFLFMAPKAPVDELLLNIEPLKIDHIYNGFLIFFLVAMLIFTGLSGIHFSLIAIKTDENPEIRWKGRFLLIAFVTFLVFATVDGLSSDLLLITLSRIFLVFNCFCFYAGFILPEWLKKIVMTERK